MKAMSFPLRETRERHGIVVFSLFAMMGFVIPYLGWPQPVTGTLVNALLILAVEWCGVRQAIFIGLVTPVSAALRGVLPFPLLFMTSFIFIGNALLVSLYGRLRHRSQWLALVAGASAKFVLLITTLTILVSQAPGSFIGSLRPSYLSVSAVQQMMGLLQLLTALSGGILAMGVLRITAKPKT
jgi:hypothetical protein